MNLLAQLRLVFIFIFIVILPLASPAHVLSQSPQPTVDCKADPLRCGTDGEGNVTTDLADPSSAYNLLGDLIGVLMYIIIIGGAVTAFVFFIIGAIQWGTAGSGDGAASARKTMLYAAAGLVAVALVYVVMLFFNSILPSGLPTPDCSPGTNC